MIADNRMDKDSLRAWCETLSKEALLWIVNNKLGYTDQIVRAVQTEIQRRAISKEEIRAFRKRQDREAEPPVTGNITADLNIGEKLLFFFLFIGRFKNFWRPYIWTRDYVLKQRQANYYTLFGGLSLLGTLMGAFYMGFYQLTVLTGAMTWLGWFVVCWLIDVLFNKRRTMRQLKLRADAQNGNI